jgi:hypothetical protein
MTAKKVCPNFSSDKSEPKGGLTPRQQLATYCLQHFLVMTGNIYQKCCKQHVANCCLGGEAALTFLVYS